MGLVRELLARYPRVQSRLDDVSRPLFDAVFIDLATITRCARQVVPETDSPDHSDLYNEVIRILDLIVATTCPSSLLFLADEAILPRALSRPPPNYDFCEYLHDQLPHFVVSRISESRIWRSPEIVYSPYVAPGESCSKFISFIEESEDAGSWHANATVSVFSDTSNLLFSLLRLDVSNLCLITLNPDRPSQMLLSSADFNGIWIGLLRESLSRESRKDIDVLAQDLIVLSFFSEHSALPDLLAPYFTQSKTFLASEGTIDCASLASFLSPLLPPGRPTPEESRAALEALYFHWFYLNNRLFSWTWQFPRLNLHSFLSLSSETPTFAPGSPEELFVPLPRAIDAAPFLITSAGLDDLQTITFRVHYDRPDPPCFPTLYSILETESSPNSASTIKSLIGHIVLADWPFWKPALVVAVSDHTGRIIHCRKNRFKMIGPGAADAKLTVEVKLLRFSDPAESSLAFADEIVSFPFALTRPIGDLDVFATIQGRRSVLPAVLSCSESLRAVANPRPLTWILVQDGKEWLTLNEIARQLGIVPDIAMALVSDAGFGIGIGLVRGGKCAEGLCRLTRANSYEFTRRVVAIVEDYLRNVGPFELSPIKTMADLEKLIAEFPEQQLADQHREWVARFRGECWIEYRDSSDRFLSDAAIRAFESSLAESASFRNFDSKTKFASSEPQNIGLGSRVFVSAQARFVPFGVVGTVIGMTVVEGIVYVIADEAFERGSTLNGRLKTKRGVVAPVATLTPVVAPPISRA